MPTIFSAVIPSHLGKIGIAIANENLTALKLLPDSAEVSSPQDLLSQKIKSELDQYFKNPSHIFSLPIHLNGTSFQQKVWLALMSIPSGQTITYGALAKQLQTGPRAIGQACRTNPITIIVPCHRVVATNHIGGYAGNLTGKLLDIKKWLLKHEAT